MKYFVLVLVLVLNFCVLGAQVFNIERVRDLSQVPQEMEGASIKIPMPKQIIQQEVYWHNNKALYKAYAPRETYRVYKKWVVENGQMVGYVSNPSWASKLKPNDYVYYKIHLPQIQAEFKDKKKEKINGYTCRKATFDYENKKYEAYLAENFPFDLGLTDFSIQVKGKFYPVLSWQELGTDNQAKLETVQPQLEDYATVELQLSFDPELALPFDGKQDADEFQIELGKIHILYYSGLHCQACFRDFPELVKLQAEYPQVRFGIASPGFTSTWLALLKHLDIALPIWNRHWPKGVWEISPSAAIYNEKGEIIYQTRQGTKDDLVLPLMYEALVKYLGLD